jgi:hypothetical protein
VIDIIDAPQTIGHRVLTDHTPTVYSKEISICASWEFCVLGFNQQKEEER